MLVILSQTNIRPPNPASDAHKINKVWLHPSIVFLLKWSPIKLPARFRPRFTCLSWSSPNLFTIPVSIKTLKFWLQFRDICHQNRFITTSCFTRATYSTRRKGAEGHWNFRKCDDYSGGKFFLFRFCVCGFENINFKYFFINNPKTLDTRWATFWKPSGTGRRGDLCNVPTTFV